ncbi:MAG: hypothetical protein GY853_01800 [PVC group bacterium]|nr:hypothetical protein [PVC group bacterium]
MAINKYDTLFTIRHPELKKRENNWQLIYHSYVGGVEYSEAGYLIKYPKESMGSFTKRKERAVYFNQMSPIVDMISGMLFLNKPTREIPQELKYFETSITPSGDKNLNEFMRLVAAYSFMFTCGVLIDSPEFDPEEVKTKKDRVDNKLNPYSVLYLPFKIRDFYVNEESGELEWILLDNSYIDHSDPFLKSENIYKYTLWDREKAVDYTRRGERNEVLPGEERYHNLGFVPFRFVSWRDDNSDFIAETVCEDIAMVSKLIYNNMSYMDEMLASGTFKMLAYPTKDGSTPDELSQGGVGPLSILPYDLISHTEPSFIGAELSGIDPFVKAINFYMTEILKKVGLSTDEMKEFVKSGTAKRIDMEKMRALLTSGAMMMSKLEEWMMFTAAKWEGKSVDGRVDYTSSFSDEDLETEVTLLTGLLVHPVKSLKIEVLSLLVRKLLGNYLEPEVLESIQKDIETNTVIKTDDFAPQNTQGVANKILNKPQEKVANEA